MRSSQQLHEKIVKVLDFHESGLVTDQEFVGLISAAFEDVRYPAVHEVLGTVE